MFYCAERFYAMYIASIGSLLDTILDRTVVVGYTRAGYRVRQRAWDRVELQPMDGKVVLVTGASSGLGLAAAEGFARLGAAVRLLVRDERRGERARTQIVASSGNSDIDVDLCDVSDLEDVRRYADRLGQELPRLSVLVNNAGALVNERTLSVDGIELTFATNVVGPFLLTNLLVPLLEKGAPARIVNVSSGGMYTQRIHLDDLQMSDEEFDGPTAYARSKRAEVMLTETWAHRLRGVGVVAHAMHPGWVDTPGLRSSLPRFYRATKPLLRTPLQGADTIVWLGAAPEPGRSSGGFWHDRRQRPTHRVPWTKETLAEREQLWAECERLSGWHERRPPSAETRAPSDSGSNR
jgi:NAD(P)-dependent dehydrogenase (short-subunit alcohol dehydrogenase family)